MNEKQEAECLLNMFTDNERSFGRLNTDGTMTATPQ